MSRQDVVVPVVFVAGAGRSGSSLFADVLGVLGEGTVVGELRQIWTRGIQENWYCGCGKRFSDCPEWQRIIGAWKRRSNQSPATMAKLTAKLSSARYAPRLLLHAATGRWTEDERRLQQGLATLYQVLYEVTGNRCVVDASKTATYGLLLAGANGVRLRTVHLVRDPRAVAHSWTRRRVRMDAGTARSMKTFGPSRSAAQWLFWNFLARLLRRASTDFVTVRYEDFVRSPADAVTSALGAGDVEMSSDTTVHLPTTHTVSGNPARMTRGIVDLRPDDAWHSEMSLRRRWLVSIISAPMLRTLGYRFRPPRART